MDATPDATPPEPARRRDPVLAVLLGWLVPGLGHVYVGRPGKGLFYLALVAAVFGAGLLFSRGLCVNPEREPVWFVGQAFAGAPAALAAWLTRDLLPTERIPTFDVGLLYTTVGGLLNLVAISDVLGAVDARARAWDAWHAESLAALGRAAAYAASTAAPPLDIGPGPAPIADPAPAADDAGAAGVPPWDPPASPQAEASP